MCAAVEDLPHKDGKLLRPGVVWFNEVCVKWAQLHDLCLSCQHGLLRQLHLSQSRAVCHLVLPPPCLLTCAEPG